MSPQHNVGGLNAPTIVEALEAWAAIQPEHVLYRFMADGDHETVAVTYFQMTQRARAIAHRLQPWRGERALMLYHSGIEFLEAFLGCLYRQLSGNMTLLRDWRNIC